MTSVKKTRHGVTRSDVTRRVAAIRTRMSGDVGFGKTAARMGKFHQKMRAMASKGPKGMAVASKAKGAISSNIKKYGSSKKYKGGMRKEARSTEKSYQTGPRGGRFYISATGAKVYGR